MNTKTLIALLGTLGIVASTAVAQNTGAGPGNQNGKPEPVTPPQYNRPATPAEVQARLQQFKQDREVFLTRQRAMEQQLKDASEQERDRIREQLCDRMEQFKKEQSRLREQLCDQADRQRDQLRDHNRILDRATNPGNAPAAGGQGNGARGR